MSQYSLGTGKGPLETELCSDLRSAVDVAVIIAKPPLPGALQY